MIRKITLDGRAQEITILSADYSKYNAKQLFDLSGNKRRYVKENGQWRFFTQAELEQEKQDRITEYQLQQKRYLFKMATVLNNQNLISEAEKNRIKSELGI